MSCWWYYTGRYHYNHMYCQKDNKHFKKTPLQLIYTFLVLFFFLSYTSLFSSMFKLLFQKLRVKDLTIYVWSFFWCYCFLGEDATQDIKVLFNKTKTEIRWLKSTYLLIKRMSLYRLLLSQQAVSIPNRGVKRLMNFLVSHWIIDIVSIETTPD